MYFEWGPSSKVSTRVLSGSEVPERTAFRLAAAGAGEPRAGVSGAIWLRYSSMTTPAVKSVRR